MHAPLLPLIPLSPPAIHPGCPRLWLMGWLHALLGVSLLLTGVRAEEAAAKDEFSPLVKLAPFVVNGQSLAISIYARTKADRRYGEEFAERVSKVVYEAVTESTGKGLVIIGAKGEPHPIFVFRKFQALAKDGKLDPGIAAREPELFTQLNRWEHLVDDDQSKRDDKANDRGKDHDVDLDFDKIVTALPLPLEGIGAKLYQLAWEEKFDDAKVEAKLRALRPADLERRDLFKSFDWVFYLPPKSAFDKVLDDIIAEALKEDDAGFFARVAVKSVLLVVKPKIRRAIEAMRQGVMLMTVVQARTHYSEKDVSSLAGAYIKALMHEEKSATGTDHERAVQAVRARLKQIEENAKPVTMPPEIAAEAAKRGTAP